MTLRRVEFAGMKTSMMSSIFLFGKEVELDVESRAVRQKRPIVEWKSALYEHFEAMCPSAISEKATAYDVLLHILL